MHFIPSQVPAHHLQARVSSFDRDPVFIHMSSSAALSPLVLSKKEEGERAGEPRLPELAVWAQEPHSTLPTQDARTEMYTHSHSLRLSKPEILLKWWWGATVIIPEPQSKIQLFFFEASVIS